jgi:hypothetical protein
MSQRNPFGLALGDALTQPMRVDVPQLPPIAAGTAPQQGMGKGQMIAGIIADVLAGAMGRPGQFAQQLGQQRQQENETAQWHQRRGAENEDWMAREQWQLANRPPPAPTEFERILEASGVQRGTPQWTETMGKRAQAMLNAGDPDVVTTLSNGQMYAGPRSGLAAALMGGGSAPQRPAIGAVVPDPRQGGQTPPASGNFPTNYGGFAGRP